MLLKCFIYKSRKLRITVRPSLALYERKQPQPAKKRIFELREVVHSDGNITNVRKKSNDNHGLDGLWDARIMAKVDKLAERKKGKRIWVKEMGPQRGERIEEMRYKKWISPSYDTHNVFALEPLQPIIQVNVVHWVIITFGQ